MVKRVPSPAIAHVSCAPSKRPDVDFAPVRLQAEGCSHQPGPAHRAPELKRQVRIRSETPWFDVAFVAYCPSCGLCRPCPVPGPPRAPSAATPSAHGSVAPGRLGCPSPPHYHDPDVRISTTPPDFPGVAWLYRRPLPDDLVWAALETVPTLSHSPCSACQCLYAGGNDECVGPAPSPPSSPSPSKGGLGSLIALSLAS